MADAPHYFTLEQANAVVKAIRPMMAEILEIRRAILAQQPRVWPVIAKAAGNGGSREASQVAVEFQHLDGLVREIQATGAVLKDINEGLIDFLALYQGREIYLCWKFGEEQIDYWHDVDAGFSGRQRLA